VTDSELACAFCEKPIPKGRRGKPRRFCGDQCRAALRSKAEKIGIQVIRRRREGRRKRPPPTLEDLAGRYLQGVRRLFGDRVRRSRKPTSIETLLTSSQR
jgi:hypothetical protein